MQINDMPKEIDKLQTRTFELLSNYLNNSPDLIDESMMNKIGSIANCSKKKAFLILLSAACGLDTEKSSEDQNLFEIYFTPAIHHLDTSSYINNPYYKNIKFDNVNLENWELKQERYKAYEAFVYNDIEINSFHQQIPQIGFFDKEFLYPAVMENNRLWMSVTPNEIETMKKPIDQAFGNVLTFGLGLGYFPYMVSLKNNVDSITIVEKEETVIQLFKKLILPQFNDKEKIKIIKDDAFEYAKDEMNKKNYDFVFTDLWHDVSDGIPMYIEMKKHEKKCPNTKFTYWIEKSMLCYL